MRLISIALQSASSHGIEILSITCDRAPTNFDAMRSLGFKCGKNLNDIKVSFSFRVFNHPIFFIPDVCHMLKLARNALADVKELIDKEKVLVGGNILTLYTRFSWMKA